jgi:type I restriction enzyme R subunit
MSNISYEEEGIKASDIKIMSTKRIVFIVDEAHRSTFGEMLSTIKNTFPSAIFFGFTGTPIQEENQKKMNTTASVFGNELHRYSIADGIRDKNVLGFDPYKVLTFQDKDVKRVIALEHVKATSLDQVYSDPQKFEVFNRILNDKKVKMAGYIGEDGSYVKGFEDFLPKTQYHTDEHTKQVVKDISNNWQLLSQNGKFHALFATSSIPEAINYYQLLKREMPILKVTCLFDPSIDNEGEKELIKEDGLIEIIDDYNKRYDQTFSLKNYDQFKRDISSRLAHKEPYRMIEKTPENQIDLLIVVNQMLTGFDSKWINTLYIDKLLHFESIIQAFSRTNRLFGPEKPFGTIRYYRYPHTMERNINDAVKLYSGDKPIGLFVEKLEYNLRKLNEIYQEIFDLFDISRVGNFEKLPDEKADRGKFASLFKQFNEYLEAAKIQGFKWPQTIYEFPHSSGNPKTVVMLIDERTYLVLALRYKELLRTGGGGTETEIPYEIDGYLTEIDTGKIDSEYMNKKFDKYLVVLEQGNVSEHEMRKTLDELHRSFAMLTQEEQKFANLFLHDVEGGRVEMKPGKTFREYITEYQTNAKNDQIRRLSLVLGLDEVLLRACISTIGSKSSIKEFGHFKTLIDSVDREKAKVYFEMLYKRKLPESQISREIYNLLFKFVSTGGFEL